MTEPYPDQYPEKHSIVNELFINTADDNYISARWCFHESLNVDFFWLSVHCLEKYMKAVLLLNGRTSKSYHHDIVKLYADVKPLAPELLPTILSKPKAVLSDNYLRDEDIKKFVERLHRDGQADNRYQLYGYVRNPGDLWKLDQVVFNVRSLCRPLETHFLEKKRPDVPDESKRQRMLTDHPVSWKLQCNLEKTMQGERGEALRHALLNCNYAFAPDNYQHTIMDYRSSFQNPVLVRRIFDPLEGGPKNFADADKLWDWVKANIQLPNRKPNDLVAEIEAERARIKAKFTP